MLEMGNQKYKAMGMNTGFGEKQYTIMFNDGEKWISSRPVKYYRTKKGAEKEILKRLNW